MLKMVFITVMKDSRDCVYFITLGKLFQILGVFMKNECLIYVLTFSSCWRHACVSSLEVYVFFNTYKFINYFK